MEKNVNTLIEVREVVKKKKVAHPFVFFNDEHLLLLATNIIRFYTNTLFLQELAQPVFTEEVLVDRQAVFKKFSFIYTETDISQLIEQSNTITKSNYLLALGQRLTPASVTDVSALPPLKQALLSASFSAYNTSVSKALRAFEKHAERTENSYWGKIYGNPKQKEARVTKVLEAILNNSTWWNVYYHYKHKLVYEVRLPSGHGARWKKDKIEFIGFVEPFK